MALEDAATLAECLERVKASADIPATLKAFQQIREPRCKLVQEWSAMKRKRAIIPDGPEQEHRDKNFKLFNAWVRAEPWDKVYVGELPEFDTPKWKAWLNGHNAVESVSWI
jgi:salicylate hydroxylase